MARLTWDTFPKSGSAWLARTLDLCFPDHEIVWGGHRSTTFAESHNCVTVVRHPRQAAASAMCFFGYDDPAAVLDWYCRFMKRTKQYRHRVYVSRFEDLTTDPVREMREYAVMFDLPAPKVVTCDHITAAVKVTHAAHLPSKITSQREKAQSMVDDCARLSDAVAIYEQVTK